MATSEAATPTNWEEVDQSTASDPEATAEPAGQEAPPEEAETSPIEAATDSGHTATAEGPTGTEPAATAAGTQATPNAKPDAKPFVYAVDGTQVEVPGAIETSDGWIAISRDAWNRHIQTRVANRDVWRREREQMLRQLQERDPERSPEVQQAKLLIGEIEKLKEGGPEAIVDWAVNFLQNMPVLEANARAAAAEAKTKRWETEQASAQEQQVIEHYRTEIPKNLRGEIDELLKVPELKKLGLNPDDLYDMLWEMRHAIYFEAPDDLPEHGLRRGDIGVRRDVIRKHVGRYAQYALQQRQSVSEVARAKQQNAAAVQTGSKAPPAVSARDNSIASGKKGKEPTNYQEWVDSLYE